jgi:hypothetical protein
MSTAEARTGCVMRDSASPMRDRDTLPARLAGLPPRASASPDR